jgi:hypothetical protein
VKRNDRRCRLLVVRLAPKSESSEQNRADKNEDGANCYDVQSQCKVHGMDLHVDGTDANLANRLRRPNAKIPVGGKNHARATCAPNMTPPSI